MEKKERVWHKLLIIKEKIINDKNCAIVTSNYLI